jgi:SAM-dependent methyltransferase
MASQDYSEFRHLVAPELRPTDRVLELGCGNSGLGAALAADGVQHVTCTDLSGVVIERMQRRAAASASGVQYQVRSSGRRVCSAASMLCPFECGTLAPSFQCPWWLPAASEVPMCICLQVADMLQLPFPDGSFDVVIEKGALEVSSTHGVQRCVPMQGTTFTSIRHL